MKTRFVVLSLSIPVVAGCGPDAVDEQAAMEAAAAFAYSIEPEWPAMPQGWRLGDVSGVAVDQDDNVWVLHRPRTLPREERGMSAPPVIVFDSEGNYIKAWGGEAAGFEWPQNEHGLHIDSDGYVWVTGNSCPELDTDGIDAVSDDQILKLTQDGEIVLQIGSAGQSTGARDTRNLHRAADLHVHGPTNEVFVADGYGNRRVIVFDAETGDFKRQWGADGGLPGDRNPCLSPFETEWAPDQFSLVHSIRVSEDGTVYVADREHSRIQIFTLAGEFTGEFTGNGGLIASLALRPGPQQPYLYASEEERGIMVLDRATNGVVGIIDVVDGLEGPVHLTAMDASRNIYRAGLFGGISKLAYEGAATTGE